MTSVLSEQDLKTGNWTRKQDPDPIDTPFEECPIHGKKLKGTSCNGYGTTLIKDMPIPYGSRKQSEIERQPIQKVPG